MEIKRFCEAIGVPERARRKPLARQAKKRRAAATIASGASSCIRWPTLDVFVR